MPFLVPRCESGGDYRFPSLDLGYLAWTAALVCVSILRKKGFPVPRLTIDSSILGSTLPKTLHDGEQMRLQQSGFLREIAQSRPGEASRAISRYKHDD